MERTFYLNTLSSLFLDWCWRYAQNWHAYGIGRWPAPGEAMIPPSEEALDYDRGEVRLIRGGNRSWPSLGGNRADCYKLQALVVVPYKDQDAAMASWPFTIIELGTTPLASERCEVHAICRYPPAMPLFEELLLAIGEQWPEAAPALTDRPADQKDAQPGAMRGRLRRESPAPAGLPDPPVAEWRLTVEAETPAYFWNRVISHVDRVNWLRREPLETLEHGPLLLDTPGEPEHPNPDPDVHTFEDHRNITAVVLNSIDPARIPTDAEVAAFFDPNNEEHPRTLHLPVRVVAIGGSVWPLSAHRQSVHMWARIPEAVPYVTAMLQELGYPEIAKQIDAPPEVTLAPEPAAESPAEGSQGEGAGLSCIPNETDRKIVCFWRQGSASGEIASTLDYTDQHVKNRITELRKRWGKEIVPYHGRGWSPR